jgi:hypothetical protein
MSAMNSPAAVRRAPAAATPAAPARPQRAFLPEHSDLDQSLKLHLADLPTQKTELHVEGFKPSILSRLVNLFVRD